MKSICQITKWFPDLQKSIVIDLFERDSITGERSLNLLATSEIEVLRSDIQVNKRTQEICTYISHFAIRNRKMPEDAENLAQTNMYPNLYGQSFVPLNMIKHFGKLVSDCRNDNDHEFETKIRVLVSHWGCKWVDLP